MKPEVPDGRRNIPVYNEEKVIRGVINSIPKKIKGVKKISIIAVNDGSIDDSAGQIKKTKALLVNLPFNLGIGLATSTGIEAGKILGTDILVTMDGDGQHDPAGIPALLDAHSESGADVVIGTFAERLSPAKRLAWRWFRILTGLKVEDLTSGLRVYNRRAIEVLALSLIHISEPTRPY